MGVTVNTAGRILKGQKAGRSGEEGYLAWERFPNTALLKTYLLDKQVADSAGSATAFLCGVKGNYETIGVTGRVRAADCYSSREGANRVDSILKWAQDAGKDTGLVTTTQVTHATPAGLYAKTAQRKWMCDTRAKKEGGGRCKDIARQLVEDSPGKDMKVVLGGGRQMMGAPLEHSYTSCRRGDGRNLVEEWRQEKERLGERTTYVTNTGELLNVDLNTTDNLMGLFAENTLPYHLDRQEGPQGTPSLLQMTEAALAILSKGPRGFFLMVEAGHVDKGLHQNKAVKALEEVVQLDEAVSMALTTLNLEDTLILVTADHSHTLTLNGYPPRGNDIFGVSNLEDVTDELPHSTLMFSMGQGYNYTWNGTKAGTPMEKVAMNMTEPLPLMVDNIRGRRNFESTVLAKCCKLLGIRKTEITPLNPPPNEFMEKFLWTLEQELANHCTEGQAEYDKKLPVLLLAYRAGWDSQRSRLQQIWPRLLCEGIVRDLPAADISKHQLMTTVRDRRKLTRPSQRTKMTSSKPDHTEDAVIKGNNEDCYDFDQDSSVYI
ncbi:hypothetical protein Pcinc_027603 [Petrolisthes cinctipes]|uniref:Alkaline phosphatase n=1 Tax=Petrolisthes cinctipes TaxID=88211 RepID=A0AAE1F483_PETCI|nr:hypothetical protein Pcinc_027603 [Petrolisthes cinctipes]